MNIPQIKLKAYRNIDSWLGDLSYPIYHFHFQAALLAAYLFKFQRNSTGLLVSGAGLTLLCA
jgi:peptidoglycan/LPS O-acetylase OafA/YrhL